MGFPRRCRALPGPKLNWTPRLSVQTLGDAWNYISGDGPHVRVPERAVEGLGAPVKVRNGQEHVGACAEDVRFGVTHQGRAHPAPPRLRRHRDPAYIPAVVERAVQVIEDETDHRPVERRHSEFRAVPAAP